MALFHSWANRYRKGHKDRVEQNFPLGSDSKACVLFCYHAVWLMRLTDDRFTLNFLLVQPKSSVLCGPESPAFTISLQLWYSSTSLKFLNPQQITWFFSCIYKWLNISPFTFSKDDTSKQTFWEWIGILRHLFGMFSPKHLTKRFRTTTLALTPVASQHIFSLVGNHLLDSLFLHWFFSNVVSSHEKCSTYFKW